MACRYNLHNIHQMMLVQRYAKEQMDSIPQEIATKTFTNLFNWNWEVAYRHIFCVSGQWNVFV